MVCWNDDTANPNIPPVTEYGWKLLNNVYIPVTMTLAPAPLSIIELVRCGCVRTKCTSATCSCRKHNLTCTEMCSCEGVDDNCDNCTKQPTGIDDSDDSEDENTTDI